MASTVLAEMTNYVIVIKQYTVWIKLENVCSCKHGRVLKGNYHACAQDAFIHTDDAARKGRPVSGFSDQAMVALCTALEKEPLRPAGRRSVISYPLRNRTPGHCYALNLPILPGL